MSTKKPKVPRFYNVYLLRLTNGPNVLRFFAGYALCNGAPVARYVSQEDQAWRFGCKGMADRLATQMLVLEGVTCNVIHRGCFKKRPQWMDPALKFDKQHPLLGQKAELMTIDDPYAQPYPQINSMEDLFQAQPQPMFSR